MDNLILKQLLTEYDSKRTHKLIDLENRKKMLAETSKEYYNLEKELQQLSLSSIKNILSLSTEEKEKKISELQNKANNISIEKAKLLKKLNLPQNYLSPNFDCELCEDTGYVNGSLCSCIKQKLYNIEYNKSNIASIDSENFEHFNFNLYSDNCDSSYNSQYSPRQNIKKIVDISKKFIENFDSPLEKNLMFIGQTGLGKTFLSNCIAKELLDKGKTVLYQTAPVMLDGIIQEKFNNNVENTMNHILNVDLLIIDDLGTENIKSKFKNY